MIEGLVVLLLIACALAAPLIVVVCWFAVIWLALPSPWANGDAAAKEAAEADALEQKTAVVEGDDDDDDDNPMAQMMRRLSGGGRSRQPKLSEADLVAKLQLLSERYSLPTSQRLKVGDLVPPTKGLTMRGAGEPHLIVEIVDASPRGAAIDTAVMSGSADVHAGSNAFGQSMDVGVLAPGGEGTHVGMWWVESWQLEPWTVKAA